MQVKFFPVSAGEICSLNLSCMKHRIPGFDLARAYAIWGMFIVNFNVVFGNPQDPSVAGQFLAFFNGNSSTLFVMLAGMGLSILARSTADLASRRNLTRVVLRRALFLFVAGLVLQLWWPADILHFYGVYMFLAVWLLFVRKEVLLWAAPAAAGVFHVWMVIEPFETGWDFANLRYPGFWTAAGFVRNTLYNGWNPVFPWIGFFLMGMYLGRLEWNRGTLRKRLLIMGGTGWLTVMLIQAWADRTLADGFLRSYLLADYLPPTLPFMVGTASFSLVVLTVCVYAGEAWGQIRAAKALAATGRMTLTHYVAHITIGLGLLAILTGKSDAGSFASSGAEPPAVILGFSTGWFVLSVWFSTVWASRFAHGPLENLMRRMGR